MFKIMRKSEYKKLTYEIDCLRESNAYLLQKLNAAVSENKRLFKFHNDKLTKPRRDKKGRLRHANGQFAKC